jgi:prevent-host-death family protein
MKQLSLTEARAKLSTLVAEIDKGKGPIAIAQRSKVKAVLVDPEWHGRVEEELAQYRRLAKQSPLKLRGSMAVTGDLDQALDDLKKEREQSLERLIAGLK